MTALTAAAETATVATPIRPDLTTVSGAGRFVPQRG